MRIKETLYFVFKRAYSLAITHDSQSGTPILFLHGIASDSSTWKYVLPLLPDNYRPITIDLLGFGVSPKPTKCDYTTKDHAKAVIKTLRTLRLKEPVILVGHSMGTLVAIEVARRRPDMVRSLILVSAPLYTNTDITTMPTQTTATATNALFTIYKRIILHEKLTLKAAQSVMKMSSKAVTFTLTQDTWVPFKKSLQKTIMHQTAIRDISQIKLPTHFLYGKLDMFIIAKYYSVLAQKNAHITIQSYAGGHMVTVGAAKKIVHTIQN